ncbi:MAG TPA: PTS sugar transporter subunit IIA [Ignavibacteriales bacterium]|nr:PTS sugar transporter subunit IIA [Ignavibacteriales bacterium]
MKLTEIISKEHMVANLEAKDKEDLITKLVELLKDDPNILDLEQAKNDVFERENILSTGVGKGFALPHAKSSAVKGIVAAFCTVKEAIDYGALDSEPVNMALLLLGPTEQSSLHIKILSRISRMISNEEFKKKILEQTTSEDLFNCFIEEEKNYPEI